MYFWAKVLNFWSWVIKKNSVRLEFCADLIGHILTDYQPISAQKPHLEFQKYGIFEHFRGISETFFSKQEFWPKLPQNDKIFISFFPHSCSSVKGSDIPKYFLPLSSNLPLSAGQLLVHDFVKVMGHSEMRTFCVLLKTLLILVSMML